MRVALAVLPEVRELLREQPAALREMLDEMHEEDLADLLKLLEEREAAQLLQHLPPEGAAAAFERLDESVQASLLAALGSERLAPIVSEMAPDERTDFIEALPETIGEDLLEHVEKLDPEAAAEVEELARWPEDTAGGLMTTAFVAVPPRFDVAQTIERIREQGAEAETVYYVYVVDDGGKLLAVASLRDLLLARPGDPLGEVMTESVHAVAPETDQEEVARTMAKYDFAALPVIDATGRLLGVITIDDVLDVLTAEQTEDVQRMGAVGPMDERYFQTGFWRLLSKRAPWLAILFVGEFFTGTAMRAYDHVLAAVEQLAFYVPLLVSTGGNSGSQSAALIIRGIATGDITLRDWWRVLLRELGQGVVLGLFLAGLGMARVAMWGDGLPLVATVGITLIAIVLLGCTIGSMLPLLLKRLRLDPATSSTPFVATLIDVLGILTYFTVARILLASVIAGAAAGGAH